MENTKLNGYTIIEIMVSILIMTLTLFSIIKLQSYLLCKSQATYDMTVNLISNSETR